MSRDGGAGVAHYMSEFLRTQALREHNQHLERELEGERKELARVRDQNETLRRERKRLVERNDELELELANLRRGADAA